MAWLHATSGEGPSIHSLTHDDAKARWQVGGHSHPHTNAHIYVDAQIYMYTYVAHSVPKLLNVDTHIYVQPQARSVPKHSYSSIYMYTQACSVPKHSYSSIYMYTQACSVPKHS